MGRTWRERTEGTYAVRVRIIDNPKEISSIVIDKKKEEYINK